MESEPPDADALRRKMEILESENARLKKRVESVFGPDNPNFDHDGLADVDEGEAEGPGVGTLGPGQPPFLISQDELLVSIEQRERLGGAELALPEPRVGDGVTAARRRRRGELEDEQQDQPAVDEDAFSGVHDGSRRDL